MQFFFVIYYLIARPKAKIHDAEVHEKMGVPIWQRFSKKIMSYLEPYRIMPTNVASHTDSFCYFNACALQNSDWMAFSFMKIRPIIYKKDMVNENFENKVDEIKKEK